MQKCKIKKKKKKKKKKKMKQRLCQRGNKKYKDENKSYLVYLYVNRGGENILKDKMMQWHFEREKKYDEDKKTGQRAQTVR